MSGKRNQTIDVLRGIAIILVVAGHAVQLANGLEYRDSGLFYEEPVYRFIYGFHMPLFHLISGYLAAFSLNKHVWSEEIPRKATQLLLPIIAWGTIQYGIEHLKTGVLITPYLLISWSSYWLTNNWFLWSVLIAYTFVCIGHYVLHDRWLYYLMVIAVLFVTSDEYNFKMYKFVLVFFLAAYCFSMHRLQHPEEKKKLAGDQYGVCGVILMLLYLILLTWFHKYQYIYVSGFTLLGRECVIEQIVVDLYRSLLGLIGSLAFIFCVMFFTQHIQETALRKWLARLGVRSIGIYAISGVLLAYGFRVFGTTWKFSYARTIIVTIAIVVVCNMLVAIIEKFPKLSLILFGR